MSRARFMLLMFFFAGRTVAGGGYYLADGDPRRYLPAADAQTRYEIAQVPGIWSNVHGAEVLLDRTLLPEALHTPPAFEPLPNRQTSGSAPETLSVGTLDAAVAFIRRQRVTLSNGLKS